jgi:hypothetical protein
MANRHRLIGAAEGRDFMMHARMGGVDWGMRSRFVRRWLVTLQSGSKFTSQICPASAFHIVQAKLYLCKYFLCSTTIASRNNTKSDLTGWKNK